MFRDTKKMEHSLIYITVQLIAAMFLGALIGTERIMAHKSAGVRTYALVSMAAALFVIISDSVAKSYLTLGATGVQPTYVLAQIVVAIGFLSGGLYIKDHNHVSGLTTAAGLWIAAAIGSAIGFGYIGIAVVATLLTLFALTILWKIEVKIKKLHGDDDETGKAV
jgi:putative Mg2+ transporter-C (MgtC) family protein